MTTEAIPAQPAVAPNVPQQGFQVPPAGEPARVPVQPIAAPGQQPGWLPQGQPAAQPATQPQGQQPAAAPDLGAALAAIQAALGTAPQGAQPAQAAAEVPGWVPENLESFDVEGIDDPIIKSMATVMQTVGKGLDLDRVMSRALAYGDPTLIDVAYLNEKAGANAQQLVTIAQGIVQAVNAKSDAITQSVYAVAGGEAQWNASVAAFNQAAPQELRLTVAHMLDSTKDTLIQAGAKIIAEFGKNSGMIPQQGAPLLQAAAGQFAGQGLSKADFKAELAKLRPDAPGFEAAREALFARRSLGKRSGLQ